MARKRDLERLEEKIHALETQLETYKRNLSEGTDKITFLEEALDQSLAKAYAIDGGQFSYVSRSFAKAFGYDSPAEIVGKVSPIELVAPGCREMVSERLRTRSYGKAEEMHYTFTGIRKDGSYSQVEVHGSALRFGSQRQVVGVIVEMSHYEKIRDLAYYDALTGLPNKALFADRLDAAMMLAQHTVGNFAVLFVDLDEFKQVNDTVGHAAGDFVLKIAADRMAGQLRQGVDSVSRIGGDEFIAILGGTGCRKLCSDLAGNMIRELKLPIPFCDHDIRVGASIGISIFPEDGGDAGTLIRAADMAMYEAKKNGKGKFAFARDVMLND